jgi:hypothetical protein
VKALLALVALSNGGAIVQAVALGKFVFDTTGRELDLGLVGLAEFAPAALLVLVTGHVADRFDRRMVVRLALVGEALCAGALAWYVSTQPTAVGPIFALSASYGVFRAFAAPASRALYADVVDADALPRLVAMTSVSWQSALIVAPVLSGFLYVGSPTWPFIAPPSSRSSRRSRRCSSRSQWAASARRTTRSRRPFHRWRDFASSGARRSCSVRSRSISSRCFRWRRGVASRSRRISSAWGGGARVVTGAPAGAAAMATTLAGGL